MKTFMTLLLAITSLNASAVYCDNTPSEVNNDKIYAEVISRSHLELELVLVGKKDRFQSALIKVTGGKGYRPGSLPNCDAEQEAEIEWIGGNIATEMTMDYSSFVSSYRICLYSVRRELLAEYTLCNWETGD